MNPDTPNAPVSALEESAEELYEMAPCGYLTTTIDGRIVRRDEQALRTSSKGRFSYTATVPLGNIAPGRYVLSIEAYTRDGVPASASQQLNFEVGRES